MTPGIVSKLSSSNLVAADTISPKTDIVFLTGGTQINTIIPNFGGGFSGQVILISLSGFLSVGTTGNVLGAVSTAAFNAVPVTFCKSRGKWVVR